MTKDWIIKMAIGRFAARVVIGGLFVGHGLQKLNGSFGGPGLEQTAGGMASMGLYPPERNALAAAVTETAGGAALALGIATPLASASLIGTMITAIRKAHLPNGPWNTNGGWEYNAVLIAALAALADDGPGKASFDGLIGKQLSGAKYALGALALGAAASTAVIEAGKRATPPPTPEDAPAAAI